MLMNQSSTWEMPLFDRLSGEEKYVAQLIWEYRRHFDPKQPTKVWHYTSVENFEKILSSQQLWFTHVSSLSDASEVARVADMAKAVLDASLQSDGIASRVARMLSVLRAGLLSNRSQSIWYTASFSELADSAMHWREYGQNFSGVGVEFDAKELLRFLSPGPNDRLMMGPIIYDTPSTLDFMSKLVAFATDNFCSDFHRVEDDQQAAISFVSAWGKHAEVFSVLSKQEQFANEREWRLARRWPWSTQNPDQKTVNSRVFWPTGRGQMSDSKATLLPITRILLGSEAKSEVHDRVNSLLIDVGYTAKFVERSEVRRRAA
jgi:Protein of unknown function (DUF2971)